MKFARPDRLSQLSRKLSPLERLRGLLLAESAISVKPPKAVAGWFVAASNRQLWGGTTIACLLP